MDATLNVPQFGQRARRLRIDTLSKLRWLALSGQLATVLVTALAFRFALPLAPCLGVIGVSALLNIAIRFFAPKILRLDDGPATALLAFDILQLAALLYLTGGLENPFSVLFLAPVTIAAVSLPRANILAVALLMAGAASFLVVNHLPLPWYADQNVSLPWLYKIGFWTALLVACAFICAYASRVAGEARSLSQALTEAELVLARENHLSQLDGLAAAAAHQLGTPLATIALVVREMRNAASAPELAEDLELLSQEVQRCRSIMSRLTSLATDEASEFGQTRLSVLLEQVVAPCRQADVAIEVDIGGEGTEPVTAHSPAIIYGLGNFIENAVDFARTTTRVKARWTPDFIMIDIRDDGPGFPTDILNRIGDPYITTRAGRRTKGDEGWGLGLGVFIAKTLLERTGADVAFTNLEPGGANIQLKWRRPRFENRSG